MASWMPPFLLLSLAFAGQITPDETIADTRQQLETQRRELLANLADASWMQDSTRAAIVRRTIELAWQKCAANEGAALAKASERPARLLAEAALTACQPWEKAYVSALDKGAYPYLDGRVSREDMVAQVQLQSRDAAMTRILMWRGVSTGPAPEAPPPQVRAEKPGHAPLASSSTSILLERFPKPAEHEAAPASAAKPEPAPNSAEIVVVAQRKNKCEVSFADRTLTEGELAERAKQWAASGTALRIVRPPAATYGCVAKIARHLGEYGIHLIQVVER